jgi:hypothetical protein
VSGGLLEKAQNADGEEPVPVTGESAYSEEPILESSGGLLGRAGVTDEGEAKPFLTSSQKKGIAGSIVALLILFIVYQAVMGFSLGGGSISVAGLEVDEEDNSLRVQVFVGTPLFGGIPSDILSISISYNGTVVHSATFEPKSKVAWYDIPFSDFYQGNSRGAAQDSSDIEYLISVSQGSSSSAIYSANAALMDRTINDVDGELISVTEETNCDGEGDCEKNGLDHVGAQFRVAVGATDPVESNSTGIMLHVNTDYTLVASITFEDSVVYTFPTVTVDGSDATWAGGESTVEGAWLDLKGDGVGTDSFGSVQNYIQRGDFFDGDGCYSIEVTVTQESPFGGTLSDTSSQGYYFWWDYNENRETEQGPGPDNTMGTDDDTPGEEYKPTEAC